MHRKYDVIFSIGEDCNCSLSLRKAKLQLLSFPADWIGLMPEDGPKTHSCPKARVDAICADFDRWFEKEDFRFLSQNEGHPAAYENTRTGWLFYHDFAAFTPLDVAYPPVREKYDRRTARFLSLLDRAKSMLFVQLDRPTQSCPTTFEEFADWHARLSEKFRGKTVDGLLIRLNRGHSAEHPLEREIAKGMTLLEFDYSHDIPNKPPYQPDFDVMAKVLRKRFAVRDYRPSFWSRILGALRRKATASFRHGEQTIP